MISPNRFLYRPLKSNGIVEGRQSYVVHSSSVKFDIPEVQQSAYEILMKLDFFNCP